MARSGGRCEVRIVFGCRGSAEHVHHRKLRAQGGKDEPENLIVTCDLCHEWIHRNPKESYLEGWLVHSYAEPSDVAWGMAA